MKKGPRKTPVHTALIAKTSGFRGGAPSYEDYKLSNNIAHVISL